MDKSIIMNLSLDELEVISESLDLLRNDFNVFSKLDMDDRMEVVFAIKYVLKLKDTEVKYYIEEANDEELKALIIKAQDVRKKDYKKLGYDFKIGNYQFVQANSTYKKRNPKFSDRYMIQTSYEVIEGEPYKPINIGLHENLNLDDSIALLREENKKGEFSKHISALMVIKKQENKYKD